MSTCDSRWCGGLDAISPRLFDDIVERRLQSNGWYAEPQGRERLREICARRGGSLRPCYPRDLFQIIESIAEFEEASPELTARYVERAAELYFGQADDYDERDGK